MTAGPGDPHLDLVAGRGDRAGPRPDLADVEAGVAVHGKDAVNRGDPARRHHVEGAAGNLLGGLEDQADPAWQGPGRRLAGQEEPGAEQHRGVHVMPAGVAGALDGGAVGHVFFVVDRQRVKICPQRDQRVACRRRADVHDQPGPLGQNDRPQSRGGEPLRHPGRGPVLVVAEFRVRMEVAAERDQLILMGSEELVEFLRQIMPEHEPPPRMLRPGSSPGPPS